MEDHKRVTDPRKRGGGTTDNPEPEVGGSTVGSGKVAVPARGPQADTGEHISWQQKAHKCSFSFLGLEFM